MITSSIVAADDVLARTSSFFLLLMLSLFSAHPEDTALVTARMCSLLAERVSLRPQQPLLTEPWLTVSRLADPLA